MRTLFTALCVGAVIAFPRAEAMVGTISLEKLIADSDAIVVAQVIRLPGPPRLSGEERYATAQVLTPLKGSLAGSFRFLASPSWICDISDAEEGEVVLLFLNRKDENSFFIAQSGRGRMAVRRVAGKTYVTLSTATIKLPSDAPFIPGPDPKVTSEVSVELPFIRVLIAKPAATKPAA
jgi:hypothetical protein